MRQPVVAAAILLVAACGGPDRSPAGGDATTDAPPSSTPADDDPGAHPGATSTDGPSPGSVVLTEEDGGQVLTLGVDEEVTWQLSSEWSWQPPEPDAAVVKVTPVDYLTDPGYQEWLLVGARPGSSTVRTVGTPACSDPARCPEREVTIHLTVTE